MKTILIFLIAICGASAEILPLPAKFIRAIHQVESNGRLGAIKGDYDKVKGIYLALGPLQIHSNYWFDAISHDKSIGGKYTDCSNLTYSAAIMLAYLNRYEKKAILNNDFESLARCHNGGPSWRNKTKATNDYWKKIKNHLENPR